MQSAHGIGSMAVFVLVGLLAALGAPRSLAEDLPFEVIENGPSLPDFTFEFLDEDGTKRDSGFIELRGKPIVAVAWATWCGVCASELPRLARLQSELGDAVRVVALSIDDQGIDHAARALRKRQIALPVFHDTDKMFFLSIGARGVPTSVIADRDGRIVARSSGSVPWDDPAVQRFLKRLARQIPAAIRATSLSPSSGSAAPGS